LENSVEQRTHDLMETFSFTIAAALRISLFHGLCEYK
jgi:hypothetical protein